VPSFNHFHLIRGFERLSQAHADITATGDYDSPYRVVQLAHFAQYGSDILARRDEEHLVVFFDDRIAIGNDSLTVAIDNDNPALDIRYVLG